MSLPGKFLRLFTMFLIYTECIGLAIPVSSTARLTSGLSSMVTPKRQPFFFRGGAREGVGDSSSTALHGASSSSALQGAMSKVVAISTSLLNEFKALSPKQKMIVLGSFLIGFATGRIRPFWKRYTDVMEIPNSLFGYNATPLKGRVASVSDGDTIRFLHQPTIFSPKELKKGQKVSEFALPIRLCSMDTPETSKFGKEGQPFGEEAKQNLKKLLENKLVHVRLLQKDQYGRAVAEVFTGRLPPFRKYMDEEQLKAGLAEVYVGGGAVYGPKGKDGYLAMQEKAQKRKIGIWSLGNRESAAEYKKRNK